MSGAFVSACTPWKPWAGTASARFAQLVDLLEDDELPQGALLWLLKFWGVWHGLYPAARLGPLDHDEMKLALERLQQRLGASP